MVLGTLEVYDSATVYNINPNNLSNTMAKSKEKRKIASSFYHDAVLIFISGVFSAVLGADISNGSLASFSGWPLLIALMVFLIIIPLAVAKLFGKLFFRS